jgi:hypothetical protein
VRALGKLLNKFLLVCDSRQGLEIAKVGSEVGLLENWRCTHYKLSVQSRAVNQPKIPHTLSEAAAAGADQYIFPHLSPIFYNNFSGWRQGLENIK